MASYTRLPKTYPKSLKYVPKEEPGPLVKARTHERKAEKMRDDDDVAPHLEYLERWKALEQAIEKIKQGAKKEWAFKLAKDDMGPHELLGHLIASLPKARTDRIFKDERISELNLLLAKRQPRRLIDDNELLGDLGITFNKTFLTAKKDLKFGLGLQAYKAGQALGLYLLVVRAACDPKVRKDKNLVSDGAVLEVANGLLRDVTTHVVEEMQVQHDEFFRVGDRKEKWAPPHGRKV
jgi:hypothetical protein